MAAQDAADINRSIFNEEAASYDDKHRKLNERLTRELQARLDFIGVDWASDDEDSNEEGEDDSNKKPGREVRLLDYACGTGMMSRALLSYTTQCVGMDISEKMVSTYNTRAENQGLSPEEMHAVLGDLASDTVSGALSSSELFNFDIAVVGGGFHHFGDPALAAKRLVGRLRPGGVLLIWDFLPHGPLHRHGQHGHGHGEGEGHSHSRADEGDKQKNHDVYHSVMHHGFSESQMREIFTAAGAGTDFRLEVIGGGFTLGQGHHQHQQQDGDQNTVSSGSWTEGDAETKKDKEEDKDKEAFRRQVFFARGTKGAVGT
ncbi:S-adenosyl-L-methionine-dependent methyltransferase [Xylaria castorea]|nr:S-adenosyl-L-methionine-dependent methyltransferase [Xylaria castorea]